MSLVNVLKVSLCFVEREIFHEIGFQVEPGDRIGLVGPNGSGKTSLLRLLVNEITPDSGEVRMARGIRVGYLPQDVQENLQGPLLPTVLSSIPDRVRLESALARVQERLEAARDREEQSRLARELAGIHQEIADLDREFPPHEAERILAGLGFAPSRFDDPISSLSGGWKMRAALACRLYQRPDLLLLDEPTNHLDIPTVRWLEDFLENFKGAIILVAHDRDFLNRQVRRIISFEPEGMRSYRGNYDAYLKAREEETRVLEARARNQEQKVRDAEKFIRKFRAKASKARQAQSKIKLIRKMDLVKTHQRRKTVHFSFPEVPRSGRDVVTLTGLSKGFGGGTPLYEDVNLVVTRGERVAVIGPNGCGKTTLLRLVAGEIPPDRGRVSLGHGVSMGYFAQHHSDMLMPGHTVLEEVYRVVPHQTVGFVRNTLGAFLFSGPDVDKPISVLSGGEKARVALAKLLVNPGNLMVMDEPTNHLDITSSETLIDALEKYTGTLLFVSHNQSFVNRLATKIWDIRDGRITVYPGNLREYYDHLEREAAAAADPGASRHEDSPGTPGPDPERENRKERKRRRAEERRMIRETLRPIRERLEKLEQRISDLELRQGEIEKRLADPGIFRDKDKGVPLLNEYNQVREELDRLLYRWERDQARLEAEKKRLGEGVTP